MSPIIQIKIKIVDESTTFVNVVQKYLKYALPAKALMVLLDIIGDFNANSAIWNSQVSGRWLRYFNLLLKSCNITSFFTHNFFIWTYFFKHFKQVFSVYLRHRDAFNIHYSSFDGFWGVL